VRLVELADLRQADLVVSRVAAVLGVEEEPGRPLAETVAGVLRPRRLLLALDNCEHLAGACARLCQELLGSSPGLAVVLTSREPLHVTGETVWQVPPLRVAAADADATAGDAARCEAVRLFADRAAASRPGFTAGPGKIAAIASICRALDGLPLAIELAAARVRVLSVEQIQARLGDRFALLGAGDRSALPRQRTLRAAIEWSYGLLTGPEQALFRRLSVFTGWSLEMARQICAGDGVPAGEVPGLIAALAAKSLVVAEPEALGQARYRMLDTIRQYAAECLAETGESAAIEAALCDFVLRIAEHTRAVGMAQTPVPWQARVDCSHRYDINSANVSQALAWCLSRADVATGLRICIAVSPRWIVWGSIAEGSRWLDSFLALDISAVAVPVRGAALVVRAQLALPSDPAAAGSWAGLGLEVCRQAGDQYWTASALNLLTETALKSGRAGEAAASLAEALSIAQAAGDGWNEGYALGTQAAIAARRGDLPEAERLTTASVMAMRRIDQQWGAARALVGLGDLARLRGHPGQAHRHYTEALPALQDISARPEIARCLARLGQVAMELGETEQARRHLTGSLRLSHATGARIGVARGLEAFATLAGHDGQAELAVQLAAAASALREAADLPSLASARVEGYLAPARRLLGDDAVTRLWNRGPGLTSEQAVTLALETPPATAAAGPPAGPQPVPAPAPGPLTAREQQVATLVAAGCSNSAIAEELSISPATAARHITNILAKLAMSSRTQIAAWAASGLPASGQASPAPPVYEIF
jgi:predicted ATPase/DNA-binding NarL/FixJ family response regulator